jgi:Armadillo/beta-catenin-like repeat
VGVGRSIALLILQIEIFIAEPNKSTLSALLEVLKGAQDVGQISSALDSVISHAPHTSEGWILTSIVLTYCGMINKFYFFSESGEIHKVAAALIGAFFESHPKSFDVLERAAKATAELAKLDAGRGACAADANLITALTSVLDLNSQPSVQLQACRALGNICYENGIFVK